MNLVAAVTAYFSMSSRKGVKKNLLLILKKQGLWIGLKLDSHIIALVG